VTTDFESHQTPAAVSNTAVQKKNVVQKKEEKLAGAPGRRQVYNYRDKRDFHINGNMNLI